MGRLGEMTSLMQQTIHHLGQVIQYASLMVQVRFRGGKKSTVGDCRIDAPVILTFSYLYFLCSRCAGDGNRQKSLV